MNELLEHMLKAGYYPHTWYVDGNRHVIVDRVHDIGSESEVLNADPEAIHQEIERLTDEYRKSA